jgi:hypothetical protein
MKGKEYLAAKFRQCTPSAARRYAVVIVRSSKKGVSVVKGTWIQTFVGDWSTKILYILNFGIVKFYETIYLRFLQGRSSMSY